MNQEEAVEVLRQNSNSLPKARVYQLQRKEQLYNSGLTTESPSLEVRQAWKEKIQPSIQIYLTYNTFLCQTTLALKKLHTSETQ